MGDAQPGVSHRSSVQMMAAKEWIHQKTKTHPRLGVHGRKIEETRGTAKAEVCYDELIQERNLHQTHHKWRRCVGKVHSGITALAAEIQGAARRAGIATFSMRNNTNNSYSRNSSSNNNNNNNNNRNFYLIWKQSFISGWTYIFIQSTGNVQKKNKCKRVEKNSREDRQLCATCI